MMRSIENEPLVLLADTVFRAFLSRQIQGRLNHIFESSSETILVAIADCNRSRSLRIHFKQHAIEVVVVVENTIRSEQDREKPERRNVVARDFQAYGHRRGKQ